MYITDHSKFIALNQKEETIRIYKGLLHRWPAKAQRHLHNLAGAFTANTRILTHTSKAKFFMSVTLINIQGLAEIFVPVRGYGRHSPKQVMIKREWLTDEVLLSFS